MLFCTMFQDLSKILFKNTPLFIVLPHAFKKGQVKKTNTKKKTPWYCTKRKITIT